MVKPMRGNAVRKLRDPQQLDTAIRLTSPSGWMALAALTLIVAIFLVWVFLGKLPYQADGLGVVLQRNSAIFDLPSPTAGEIVAINVKQGQRVKAGELLVRLRVPEALAQVDAAKRVVDSLKKQRAQRQAANQHDSAQQQQVTQESIAAQRSKINDLKSQLGYLANRRKSEEEELARGFITRDVLEKTIESQDTIQQQISDARIEITRLRSQQRKSEASDRRALASIDQQILDAQNKLDELNTTLVVEHEVTSPASGVIEEISSKVGDTVSEGERLITVSQVGKGLQMYAYLPISKGKRIAPGMLVRVSPSTVERDVYGSITGHVASVSPLPASQAELHDKLEDSDLVNTILKDGAPIEVVVNLKSDPSTVSGLAWSSSKGPPIQISPGTTATATITVQQVTPINLFVPLVETWTGGH